MTKGELAPLTTKISPEIHIKASSIYTNSLKIFFLPFKWNSFHLDMSVFLDVKKRMKIESNGFKRHNFESSITFWAI